MVWMHFQFELFLLQLLLSSTQFDSLPFFAFRTPSSSLSASSCVNFRMIILNHKLDDDDDDEVERRE